MVAKSGTSPSNGLENDIEEPEVIDTVEVGADSLVVNVADDATLLQPRDNVE